MNEPAPSAAKRLVFLDVLRLIAAVQMIQGHTVDAALAAAFRRGAAYQTWLFARGLTSVIFLVTAGLAFVLAEARGGPAARRRRAQRALTIIVLGYLMHAPIGILFGTPRDAAFAAASAVDVLQCIGVSLLALELLSLAIVRLAPRVAVALALAALCFLLAPATAQLDAGAAPRLLANYLTTRHGSLFPLVPWSGYVFAGFGLGQLALRTRLSGPGVLGAAALAGGALAGLGLWLGPKLPTAISPAYCLLKLACVLGLSAALMAGLRDRQLPPTLTRLAGETLFLYLSHVVVLYADHVGIAPRLGGRHGPGVGVLLALVLLVACSAGALGWARLLQSLRVGARGGTRGASP
jgi:uncharacterized membrane protein